MGMHIFKLKPGTGEKSGIFKKKDKTITKIEIPEVSVETEPAKFKYTGPYDDCDICGLLPRGLVRNRMVWDGTRIICRKCANELYGSSVLCLVSPTYIS